MPSQMRNDPYETVPCRGCTSAERWDVVENVGNLLHTSPSLRCRWAASGVWPCHGTRSRPSGPTPITL